MTNSCVTNNCHTNKGSFGISCEYSSEVANICHNYQSSGKMLVVLNIPCIDRISFLNFEMYRSGMHLISTYQNCVSKYINILYWNNITLKCIILICPNNLIVKNCLTIIESTFIQPWQVMKYPCVSKQGNISLSLDFFFICISAGVRGVRCLLSR